MPGKKGSRSFNVRMTNLKVGSVDSRKLSELRSISGEYVLELNNLKEQVIQQKQDIILLQETKSLLISEKAQHVEEINLLKQNLLVKRNAAKRLRSKLSYETKKAKSIPHLNSTAATSFVRKYRRFRRLQKPTNFSEINERTKRRRISDMWNLSMVINGGTSTDIDPSVDGLLETLSTKCVASKLAPKILKMKSSVTTILSDTIKTEHCKTYYESEANLLRSLNIYYSSSVLGKNKYLSVRRANKTKNVPNVVPYANLAKKIREIDIGEIIPIQGTLDHGLRDDEKGVGVYRNLRTYLPRLAKFYLHVNEERHDKLLVFGEDETSILFLFSIGGDEAPSSGTAFLVSFLNIGKRVCSSFENFLIFGGNVKENGEIIKRYVAKLVVDINYLESQTFDIKVNDKNVQVKFKLEMLPNDLKMLAFLAGELNNAAFHFSTFANANKDNCVDINMSFNSGGSEDWMPFEYDKRLSDVKKVEQRKQVLKKKAIAHSTFRSYVTTYIKELGSRQEFVPPVGKYIDKAKAEPLHLKNNVCKEMFMKIYVVVLEISNLQPSVKQFKDIPVDNIISCFVNFVSKEMKLNKLSTKLKEYWNECRVSRNPGQFPFRFRGEESKGYLAGFPFLISMLLDKIPIQSNNTNITKNRKKLLVTFIQSINLRKLISYSVRIVDITAEDVAEMAVVAKQMFRISCLHDPISPSLWTLCVITPAHTKEIFENLGLGLGVNSMEGREQKHQKIHKYMQNAMQSEIWPFVFRHEFISCVYLRENEFDQIIYNKKFATYMAPLKTGCCTCGLAYSMEICKICDSREYKDLL